MDNQVFEDHLEIKVIEDSMVLKEKWYVDLNDDTYIVQIRQSIFSLPQQICKFLKLLFFFFFRVVRVIQGCLEMMDCLVTQL